MGILDKLKRAAASTFDSSQQDIDASLKRFREDVGAEDFPLGLRPDWNPSAADNTSSDALDDGHAQRNADAESLLSLTSTLVEREVTGRLPESSLLATLVVASASPMPSTNPFIRVGLPAEKVRLISRDGKPLASFVVQLSVDSIEQAGSAVEPRAPDANAKPAFQAARNIRTVNPDLRYETVDYIPIRERQLISRVFASLFKAEDIKASYLVYPPESIRAEPENHLEPSGSCLLQVTWATLIMLPKDHTVDVGPTADQSVFTPCQRSQNLLSKLLGHIEQHGGIWTDAGHIIPVRRQKTSTIRTEFRVQGIFPERWLQRLRTRRAGKSMTLLQDAGEDGVEFVPLAKRLRQNGSSDGRSDSGSMADKTSFLEGWKVLVLQEPFRRPYTGIRTPTEGGFGGVVG